MQGRAGIGAWTRLPPRGAGAGDTNVSLHKNVKNRVEWLFEDYDNGKILYFSPDFFLKVSVFPLYLPGFFQGKHPANLRGELVTSHIAQISLISSQSWDRLLFSCYVWFETRFSFKVCRIYKHCTAVCKTAL